MNNNFDYLDGRITTVGQAITGWETQLANVNTTLTNSLNNLNSAAVKLTGSQTITGAKTLSGGVTLSGTTTHSGALNCSGAATFSGTTKVPASTTAGTALQLTAQSKSKNGYIKFGSGIIIQWGQTGGNGNKSVTFPTAFSNASYSIITSVYDTSANSAYAAPVKSVSSTGFSTYVNTNYSFAYYIAIGY